MREILRTGEVYVFSRQFLEDIPKRLTGPGRFRFVLQPAVAIFLGARAGVAEARENRPPFLQAVLFNAEHRSALIRSALSHVAVLVSVAILFDAISQLLIFGNIHPGAALVVGPVLISVPYGLSRALANRVARQLIRRHH